MAGRMPRCRATTFEYSWESIEAYEIEIFFPALSKTRAVSPVVSSSPIAPLLNPAAVPPTNSRLPHRSQMYGN